MSRMVSILEDEDWKRVRAIISPTFSSGKLRRMRPLIDDCIKTLVSNFGKLIDKENPKTFVEVDTKHIFGSFSMDVIIQVAFGTKVDSLIDEDNPIIDHARSLFSRKVSPKLVLFFLFPALGRKLGINLFDPKLTEFFKDLTMKIIDERKKNPSKEKRFDFLGLMLDAMETKDLDAMNENENVDNSEKKKAQEMNEMTPDDSQDYLPIMTHNKCKYRGR
jgi:cytochrome P450 family 3 subfamily A